MTTDSLAFIRRLTFKRANALEQTQARELFRQVYSKDVHYVPSDVFDKSAAYLVALTADGDMIASLRFLGPEFRPFEIEHFCDFSQILSPHRTPALVGRLSVGHGYRKVPESILVHFGLLKLAVDYARKSGVTDLFLYTLPHLVNFYRSVFFRPVGNSFEYPALSATMHIMRLDLGDLDRRCQQSGSPRARLMLLKDPSNFLI